MRADDAVGVFLHTPLEQEGTASGAFARVHVCRRFVGTLLEADEMGRTGGG
ncbi:hypothetical protein ABT026_17325 [Streptomyces sp. NPDC002734]|uniref:hypothetical protein n=1 Tax=Streptomyces sp. NPDC002734 TaxID=3154426 RepID=UPI0033248BB2